MPNSPAFDPLASQSRLKADGLDQLPLSPRTMLAAWRTEARRHQYERMFGADWNRAGCAFVSDKVHDLHGYTPQAGCYVVDGRRHLQHVWSVMSDGAIFDATADQWGELGDGIRITSSQDPRYQAACACGGEPIVALWPTETGLVGEWLFKIEDLRPPRDPFSPPVVMLLLGVLVGAFGLGLVIG